MKRLILFALFIIIGFVVLIFFAKTVSPDSPLYHIKRFDESIILTTKLSPTDKTEYYMFLLDTRLSELSHEVNNSKTRYVLSSSLRYSTTAGQLSELAAKNNLKQKSSEIKKKFLEHKEVLKNLVANHPDIKGEVKYLVDDINYLEIYEKQLP